MNLRKGMALPDGKLMPVTENLDVHYEKATQSLHEGIANYKKLAKYTKKTTKLRKHLQNIKALEESAEMIDKYGFGSVECITKPDGTKFYGVQINTGDTENGTHL